MLVVAAIVLGPPGVARAEGPDDRCEQLRRRLELEHDRATRWRYTWAIVFGAGALGQAIAAPLVNDHVQRDTLYVGAVNSAIGAAASLSDLRVEVGATCGELQHNLVDAGRNERKAFYLNHAGGLVINLAAALVLAHYTDAKNAAVSFAAGYAFSLARIYTMPRWAWHPTITLGPSPGVGIAAAF